MSRDPIVAGTDGSPTAKRAVDKAGELAQALGAPVHVVCVPSAIYAPEWPARITAQEIVADAGDRLRSQGITVQTHLPKATRENAALALVAVAEREHAQMIVVGNKGMTGIRRLIGSLPNRVSHQARCDVLIVPTQSRSLTELGGGSIVVGTDGSSGAARAVTEAIRLSRALDGGLHIASISEPSDSPESGLAAAAAEAAGQGVKAITHVLHGDPATALLDVAEKNDAAIIVVSSKGMHADEREWFGNIADKISHKGASSVLIVFTGDASGSDGDAMSVAAKDAQSSGEDAST
jgi:nucleotide-binding universal stress UspA family protein